MVKKYSFKKLSESRTKLPYIKDVADVMDTSESSLRGWISRNSTEFIISMPKGSDWKDLVDFVNKNWG